MYLKIKEKSINENNHLIWVLFLETETWLQSYQKDLLKEHISFAQFFYILNNYAHIDEIFKEIKQILFLKQSLNYKNSIIKLIKTMKVKPRIKITPPIVKSNP